MAAVDLKNPLIRNEWANDRLLHHSTQAFFAPYTGMTSDSIVYQKNNDRASGNTIVFDYSGELVGKVIKGDTTAFGKGEAKRKFESSITVEKLRVPVDNDTEFDAAEIGDPELAMHADSIEKLTSVFQRIKTQAIFDVLQGCRVGQEASHIIDKGATFGFDDLTDIGKTLVTSTGYDTGSDNRKPLNPAKGLSKNAMWVFLIDEYIHSKLLKDSTMKDVFKQADVRGDKNRLISGYLGTVGYLDIVLAPTFCGTTAGAGAFDIDAPEIRIAGMRTYDATTPATPIWRGQESYDETATIKSRGLILGAGAVQFAMGKEPEYKYQAEDFDNMSQSALVFWMKIQKTVLNAAKTDYSAGTVADIDHGVVAIDVQH